MKTTHYSNSRINKHKGYWVCTLLIILNTFAIMAQDMIFKTNGEVIEGKVVEISDQFIKYKKNNVPNDITYSIAKSFVSKIVYANGQSEIYNNTPSISTVSETSSEEEGKKFDSIVRKKKNIVGWDVAQFVFVAGGISYKRFLGKYS